MSEEEAFCLFVKLMNKYKLRTMFQEKMKGLELRLFQYDRILEDYEPRLAIHLKRQNIESSLYAAQWFLTLFTYKFPLQLVLRVFDLLFSEGLEVPILQFGIVLMRNNAPHLLSLEFDTLGPFLKEKLFDIYIDATPSANSVMEAGFFGNGGEKEVYRANDMVTDACSVKITKESLDRYEQEWEEQERTKKETETLIETLKRNNANLNAKVKNLEEQNEQLNQEYVRMASSEVALKVENDQFADENEVLKAKVDGLRDMVDKQPQEVEDRLKGEMQTLLEKSLAVRRENESLEENMMIMEKELVSSKMQLATVSLYAVSSFLCALLTPDIRSTRTTIFSRTDGTTCVKLSTKTAENMSARFIYSFLGSKPIFFAFSACTKLRRFFGCCVAFRLFQLLLYEVFPNHTLGECYSVFLLVLLVTVNATPVIEVGDEYALSYPVFAVSIVP